MRIEAALKNTKYGMVYQAVIVLLGFISRKVMLMTIGSAGIGLNGLFSNVISILSLAELGIGNAIVYRLYPAIASNNVDEQCRLMNFYKVIYRWVALAIAAVGCTLIPFLPMLVKGVALSKGYLTLIYCLFLARTVSSYFFSYNRSLLSASQKQYVATGLDILFTLLINLFSIIILFLTRSFVFYLVFQITAEVAKNALIARKTVQLYPFLRERLQLAGETRRSIFQDTKNVFIKSLSSKITNATDNILISMLVGTVEVGLYSNYTIITTHLMKFVTSFSSALTGSMGNFMHTETRCRTEELYRFLSFGMFFAGCFASVSVFCLASPFVGLWFGEEYRLGAAIVGVTSFNFLLEFFRFPLWPMMEMTGLFAQDKYIAIAGSGFNLVISIVFGRTLGILGILLGTTATYLIQYLLKLSLFYRSYLRSGWDGGVQCSQLLARTYGRFVFYLAVWAVELGITALLCRFANLPHPQSLSERCASFALSALYCLLIPNAANLLLFHRTAAFRYLLRVVKKRLPGKRTQS